MGSDSEIRLSHLVQPAIAATLRTSLELLNLPFPFSQLGLLDVDEFLREADERRITMASGWRLNASGLEELHKQGVLVPLYCVRLDDGDPSKRIDVSNNLTWQHVHSTKISQLYAAASEGRATDPSSESFAPWPGERVRDLWPSVPRGYIYSHHQLLGLNRARFIVDALRPAERVGYQTIWRLDSTALLDAETLAALSSWRSLAITLSAIDTRVWPSIVQVIVNNADTWRSANTVQTPLELLGWLGVTRIELGEQSQRLRVSASFEDVLGGFYDVIRRAKPSTWSTLRGSARTAMDSRMAAEALNIFASELQESDQGADPAPPENLSMQGLRARRPSLDAVLTYFRLSPHPPLVIALEGDTEMRVVPKVMELLGLPDDPSWIRFVNFGGTGKDLSLLAQFAAAPVFGDEHDDFVMLDRPTTRFLVLTDAENNYRTREKRERQRKLLLDSIAKPLPVDLRSDLYTKSAQIVEIMTWGKYPWEFAHFTNGQLGDALLRESLFAYPGGRVALLRSIQNQRLRAGLPNRSPDINNAWSSSGVSKLDLADALWPVLKARIERAMESDTARRPPVMKAIIRAYQLANLDYGRYMVLRRGRPSRHR
jgi:hypothetical protein